MGTLVLLGLVAMLVVWLAFGTRTVETGVRMGWVGNNVPGHMNAQFAWLDGTEGQSFEVGSGHTIVLEYAATASIGSLRIEIRGPNDAVLWQTAPTGGATRHAEVRITQSGRYTVFVVGQNALGGYDVQWWVR